MDPFALRKLGTSSIMLPQFGFGGAPLGNLFEAVGDADSEATLSAAWDAGVRFYDTSPFYGRGLSEHRIGQALRRRKREQVILSTKVGRVFGAPADPAEFAARERNWPQGLHFEYRHDYSYDGIMRSYEDSLQRLGMNRVDLLIIHDLDFVSLGSEELVTAHLATLATSGINALNELKQRGLIGAIGAGVNRLGTIPRILDVLDLDFFLVASPYTLADQPVLDAEFPRCEKRGIGFIIGQVFASGILATGPIPGARYQYREATAEEADKVRRIEAVCTKYEVPLAAAALQFPLHHPLVASVIPGALSPEQMTRNIATMRVNVPPELWHDLKRDGLLREDAPTP
jgi:D-threo-aldose 1-dehydrogenase